MRNALRRRIWPYLTALGPGLLAASAGNDAGGIATYASAGASYGYGLLWAMVLVTLFVGASQPVGRMLSMYASHLGYQRCAREVPGLVVTARARH